MAEEKLLTIKKSEIRDVGARPRRCFESHDKGVLTARLNSFASLETVSLREDVAFSLAKTHSGGPRVTPHILKPPNHSELLVRIEREMRIWCQFFDGTCRALAVCLDELSFHALGLSVTTLGLFGLILLFTTLLGC